jgi:hypothetical protein
MYICKEDVYSIQFNIPQAKQDNVVATVFEHVLKIECCGGNIFFSPRLFTLPDNINLNDINVNVGQSGTVYVTAGITKELK